MPVAFFIPNGHLCVENGQQPGTEEGSHMIKKDFMEAEKKTYGNITVHCAGCLNAHEPLHMRFFQCWKIWKDLAMHPEVQQK